MPAVAPLRPLFLFSAFSPSLWITRLWIQFLLISNREDEATSQMVKYFIHCIRHQLLDQSSYERVNFAYQTKARALAIQAGFTAKTPALYRRTYSALIPALGRIFDEQLDAFNAEILTSSATA